ncbi:hypothetical protein V8C44DRAFT_108081 [Trichoderma aethiopicum]
MSWPPSKRGLRLSLWATIIRVLVCVRVIGPRADTPDVPFLPSCTFSCSLGGRDRNVVRASHCNAMREGGGIFLLAYKTLFPILCSVGFWLRATRCSSSSNPLGEMPLGPHPGAAREEEHSPGANLPIRGALSSLFSPRYQKVDHSPLRYGDMGVAKRMGILRARMPVGRSGPIDLSKCAIAL